MFRGGLVTQEEVLRIAWEELEPELAEQGFELVEVEYGPHGSQHVLRVYIDRDGGVTIDHCAEVARFLGPYLDQRNFIQGSYNMEVSSPGIDRPVRKPIDFERFAGERIALKTVAPVEGRRRFRGVLRGIEDGLVAVEIDGVTHRIHIQNVQKAKLDR